MTYGLYIAISGNQITVGKVTSTISRIYQLYNPSAYIAGPNDPVACLTKAVSKGAGQVTVSGWAFDPDATDSAAEVHIFVGGEMGSGAPEYVISANKKRAVVNEKYGIDGKHGFSATISGKLTGDQTLYFYAMNQGEGSLNPLWRH